MKPYITNKLSNGLEYILIENNNIETCSINIIVNVGSVNETSSIRGISHFLEHLLFKKSKKYKNITEEFNKLGVHGLNASTGHEKTYYYCNVNKIHIHKCLEIYSQMLFFHLFNSYEINKERNVIFEEMNKMKDDGSDYLYEFTRQLVFKSHPLGKSIIGTENTLNNISKKHLLEFYNKYYNPNNIIIAVYGNFDKSKIESTITKYYSINNKNIHYQKIKPYNINNTNFEYIVKKKNSEQVNIQIIFPCLEVIYDINYPLRLAYEILGDRNNMSSRLFNIIREKHGLVYNIASYINLYKSGGAIYIYAGLDKKNVMKAIRLIIDELKKIKKYGFTKQEFATTKIKNSTSKLILLQDGSEIADHYGDELMLNKTINKPIMSIKSLLDKYNSITLKEVNQAFNKYVDFDKMIIGIIG